MACTATAKSADETPVRHAVRRPQAGITAGLRSIRVYLRLSASPPVTPSSPRISAGHGVHRSNSPPHRQAELRWKAAIRAVLTAGAGVCRNALSPAQDEERPVLLRH